MSAVVSRRQRNLYHSSLLLSGMLLLMCVMGWVVAGVDGVLAAVVMGLLLVVLSPRLSPQLVLKLYGARRLRPEELPRLHAAVAELTTRAGVERPPELFYIRSQLKNAFAVGSRRHSAIAVTDGLLRTLNLRELAGVMAHEMSHIRHNDMWIMGMADLISRMTSFFSIFGQFLLIINLPMYFLAEAPFPWAVVLLLVFAPTLAAVMQLGLSRQREYEADVEGALLAGDTKGLMSALVKLEHSETGWMGRVFKPGKSRQPSVLRSHPTVEERLARLRELTREQGGTKLPALKGGQSHVMPATYSPPKGRVRKRIGGVYR